MLTGKTKDAFDLWMMRKTSAREVLKYLSESCTHALIIDFFDSVGIYINIRNYNHIMDWTYSIKRNGKREIIIEDNDECVLTRQQATIEAITKGNDIFNNGNYI